MPRTLSPDAVPTAAVSGTRWLLGTGQWGQRLAGDSSREQEETAALTRDVDLELAALSEGAVDDPQLAGGQLHPEPHEQLDVGFLLEQRAANHVVVVQHLCPPARGQRQRWGKAGCS